MAAIPGSAIVMPQAYEEAAKPYLDSVLSWASLAAYNQDDVNPGNVRILGAFQRYPRVFVFRGGPR